MAEQKTSKTVQQARINDTDKEILRHTFAGREDLLLAIRNLFFGFELTPAELVLIKGINNVDVHKILRKIFLPELEKDVPIGQNLDLWMTVQIQSLDEVQLQVKARATLIEFLERALKSLENPKAERITLFIDDTNILDFHPFLIARNNFITHIETQLAVIRILANEEEETPEIRKARQLKDSSK